ncbi:MAG: glutathione S-transferase family protein [Halothece sp.]
MNASIELYYWPTPNGHKVSILLEELALPYTVQPVNILAGDQFTPKYRQLNPNAKMPTIVDPDGPGGEPYSVFESGAILLYLAEKTGRLLPSDPRARYRVIQWLMFQMGNVGPMLGQTHHFRQYAPESIPYAIERYTKEAARLYGVVEDQLAQSDYVAGDYSIADIAIFPWIVPYEKQGQSLDDYPHLKRWFEAIYARSAVQRGLNLLSDQTVNPSNLDEIARANLFGTQGQRAS